MEDDEAKEKRSRGEEIVGSRRKYRIRGQIASVERKSRRLRSWRTVRAESYLQTEAAPGLRQCTEFGLRLSRLLGGLSNVLRPCIATTWMEAYLLKKGN